MSQARPRPSQGGAAALAWRSSPCQPSRGWLACCRRRPLQVKALGVVGGLGARVADVALRVQPLGGLHGVLRPILPEMRAQRARHRVPQARCSGSLGGQCLVRWPKAKLPSRAGRR